MTNPGPTGLTGNDKLDNNNNRGGHDNPLSYESEKPWRVVPCNKTTKNLLSLWHDTVKGTESQNREFCYSRRVACM
jgi:hypothetical protein